MGTSHGSQPQAAEPAVSIDARALPKPGGHVLVGAGDIADCRGQAEQTARIVEQVLAASSQAHAFTTGDNAYPVGSPDDYHRCYGPTWGRFRDRTVPVPGNHDWMTPGAAGYFGFFGKRGGQNGRAWRSFEAGTWHVVLLDSDCEHVGGCGPDSPQGRWLQAELAAQQARCTVAIWHHPLVSSGPHGSDVRAKPLWEALQKAGAELVLQGHDHIYERFEAKRADGRADPKGLVSFVVGTGGRKEYPLGVKANGSQVRLSGSPGVLVLHLEEDAYRFFFVATDGQILDEGQGRCH